MGFFFTFMFFFLPCGFASLPDLSTQIHTRGTMIVNVHEIICKEHLAQMLMRTTVHTGQVQNATGTCILSAGRVKAQWRQRKQRRLPGKESGAQRQEAQGNARTPQTERHHGTENLPGNRLWGGRGQQPSQGKIPETKIIM